MHADEIYMQALTKWGGALLELAHFRQGSDAYGTIGEASRNSASPPPPPAFPLPHAGIPCLSGLCSLEISVRGSRSCCWHLLLLRISESL